REIRIRLELSHENIIPLLGISYDFDRPSMPCLVCPWFQNGDIINFLREQPNVDKLSLVRIAAGLSYLHSMSVVHGDVQGSNILISNNYEASLTNFGRSRVLQSSGFMTEAVSPSGQWRWMSPELMTDALDECAPRVTMATDVWAFAMTVVEVFTGAIPFSHIKSDASVIMFILSGGRPKQERCPQINDEIWEMLEKCWDVVPQRRPSMT
ncbi:hypothetical protein PILCRDRAFT_32124, partial [Piloderma croceum F 1598]